MSYQELDLTGHIHSNTIQARRYSKQNTGDTIKPGNRLPEKKFPAKTFWVQ